MNFYIIVMLLWYSHDLILLWESYDIILLWWLSTDLPPPVLPSALALVWFWFLTAVMTMATKARNDPDNELYNNDNDFLAMTNPPVSWIWVIRSLNSSSGVVSNNTGRGCIQMNSAKMLNSKTKVDQSNIHIQITLIYRLQDPPPPPDTARMIYKLKTIWERTCWESVQPQVHLQP